MSTPQPGAKGAAGTIVLRDKPGLGKTALLEHTIESAADIRLARAIGIGSVSRPAPRQTPCR